MGLCTTILEQTRDAGPGPPRLPGWRDMSDEQMLDHVPRIAGTAGRVQAALRSWALELRRRGVTGARSGESLGMTRQSAWERFSGEE